MTEAVRSYLKFYQQRTYRKSRISGETDISHLVVNMDPMTAESVRLQEMLSQEQPILYQNDDFGFHRHQAKHPHYVLANGRSSPISNPGNITPNYRRIMDLGLDAVLEDLKCKKATATNETLTSASWSNISVTRTA